MPATARVECPVTVSPELALGVYANAFRVLDGKGGRCKLEFLVYSETEHRAAVVARVPLRKALLPLIRDEMTSSLSAQAPDAGMAIKTTE